MKKTTLTLSRRHDIDWLRTAAMGLLIVYHVVICFQPWALYIGFPVNDQPLEGIWTIMAALNVWRIPVLFLISGMGVYFAMERRNWKQMLADRTIRILVPYLFGILIMQYLVSLLLPLVGWNAHFSITFGHLWFLLNIYLYFIWSIGLTVYLRDNPDNAFFTFLKKIIRKPLGIFAFALPLIVEAWLVNPQNFATYVDTLHGWLLGFICFFCGFILVSLKDDFWYAVKKNRLFALSLAVILYMVRLYLFQLVEAWDGLTALESFSWMMAATGFAATYLNTSSPVLTYLSTAVYPVYILHLPVQFLLAYYILPLQLNAELKLLIILSATFAISLLLYEFILKRVRWLRPLFGMKILKTNKVKI